MRIGCLVAGILLASACNADMPAASAACASPLRVLLVPLPATVPSASLRRLYSLPDHDADATDAQRRRMTADAAAALQQALGREAVRVVGVAPAPPEAAAAPARPAAPDMLLHLTVTDYGETPVRWKAAYVTFEVVTTLAIAGALLVHRVTRPLAGIYLVQEGAEEFGEGYAGFWLLNRLSRPVRLQADLVDAHSGAVLWQGKATGLSRWHWHELRHQDAVSREALLQSSTRKAADKLARSLRTMLDRRCAGATAP